MLLYRVILTLAAPFVLAALVWRVLRGAERWSDLAQRLGLGAGQPGAIWVHGASNGELTSARALIEDLRAAYPDVPLLVTCNTVSGRALVAGWGLSGTAARLAPLDLRLVLASFLRAWRPRVLIVLENELWPNRLTSPLPVICVAARMSERSAARWSRLPQLARAVLGRVAYLAPQDAASGQRFAALGLRPGALGPVYAPKAAVALAPPDPQELASLQAVFERSRTWLAASTHPGEEEIVLAALQLCPTGTRLILAPRHPARGATIRQMALDLGLTVAQRSRAEPPGEAQVYLADTLGEMALWYSLAGVTLVAGSLVPRGGHTPFEPARFGSALLHGPDVSNFTEIYRALDSAGAAIEVSDAGSLKSALVALDGQEPQAELARKASAVLAKAAPPSSSDPILQQIARLI